MTRLSHADELDSAAERIADISRADLQTMLKRAAIRLRNSYEVPLDPEWEDALRTVAADLNVGRNDLLRQIVKDWLIASYLPQRTIEEDSEVDGNA